MAYNEDEPQNPEVDELTGEELRQHYQQTTRMKVWSTSDTGHDLTVEEQLFVRSYIIDRNPVAALKRLDIIAPAPQLKRMAERHLANPEVQGAVDVLAKRMMDKLDITAEKVTRHLASMAFFDPRSIMAWDGVTMQVLDSRLWPDEAIASVMGIKQTEKAGIEFKFVDRLRATEILGKQLNLLQDPDEAEKKSLANAAAEATVNRLSQIFERVAKKAEALPEAPPEQETLQ